MLEEGVPTLLEDGLQFRQWLIACQTDIAGYIGGPSGCPLENWLYENTEQIYHVSRYYYGAKGYNTALPSWAQFFVQVLELEPEGAISGKDALDILESVLDYKNRVRKPKHIYAREH